MKTHGTGKFKYSEIKFVGTGVIIEDGVRIFHPEYISIGDNVYIGHNTILHGYPNATFIIGSNTWIGPQCYFHSAGTIVIEEMVGIGPCVKMFTSYHDFSSPQDNPIRLKSLIFKPILLKYGCDIGTGSIINPGVTIGKNTQIGSGSIVTRDILNNILAAGNPAKRIFKTDVNKMSWEKSYSFPHPKIKTYN